MPGTLNYGASNSKIIQNADLKRFQTLGVFRRDFAQAVIRSGFVACFGHRLPQSVRALERGADSDLVAMAAAASL